MANEAKFNSVFRVGFVLFALVVSAYGFFLFYSSRWLLGLGLGLAFGIALAEIFFCFEITPCQALGIFFISTLTLLITAVATFQGGIAALPGSLIVAITLPSVIATFIILIGGEER